MNFPKRSIHLDFHTGPDVPDVAANFDPDSFARTFKEAHVDSVTVFATCHHGHAYWLTDRPERHPSLPAGLDLVGEQIKALHSVGIRAPIYMSVQVNEFCAKTHPEWVAIDPEGRKVKRPNTNPLEAGWMILDMSSPYQDYLADQIAEVLDRYGPVDGLFLDMCWDQVSVSPWAISGMKGRGFDPREPADRATYARHVAHAYMDRYSSMLRATPAADGGIGIWFNSRPKLNLHVEKKFIDHIEVEALPTGGWGYTYFPYVARFVRPLGMPTLSHTGRFFKSWGDNSCLKPAAALKYECCQILSQGMAGGIGDLLHPRGVPAKEVYELIGSVYEYIERCEPYVAGGKHVSEAAVIVDPTVGDSPGPSGVGAVRALQQLRVQFDVRAPDADLTSYKLVIIPEFTRVDAELAERLELFASSGGAVILSGTAGFDEELRPVLASQGITGLAEQLPSHAFLVARPAVAGPGTAAPPGGDHAGTEPPVPASALGAYPYVMYEPSLQFEADAGAEVLVDMGIPYFYRAYDHFSGHDYTPFDRLSGKAAVVRSGSVVTFGAPIFEAFGRNAAPNYKRLLGNVIDALLPRRLVRDSGPSHMEVVVVDTKRARVAHLLSYMPERRADGLDVVEDPIPLVGVELSVAMEERPATVRLEPHGRELEFEYADGYARVRPDLADGHGMVVFSF